MGMVKDGMTGDEPSVLVGCLRWNRQRHPYRSRRESLHIAREVARQANQLITAGEVRHAAADLR